MPLLRGETGQLRETMHGHIDESHMLHDGRFKYLYFTDDGSELVFDTLEDPRDEHDLSDNEELTARLRQQLADHLAEEGHRDLVDGELRNDNRPAEPDHVLKSYNPLGWRSSIVR
jgi:hypothetical protein